MTIVLYANTVRDPNSKSVHHLDEFYVCKKINDKWHIIEGHTNALAAFKARKILIRHDLINGHISDETAYRIFKKGLNEIKTAL